MKQFAFLIFLAPARFWRKRRFPAGKWMPRFSRRMPSIARPAPTRKAETTTSARLSPAQPKQFWIPMVQGKFLISGSRLRR